MLSFRCGWVMVSVALGRNLTAFGIAINHFLFHVVSTFSRERGSYSMVGVVLSASV